MTNAATPVEKFDALVLGSGEAGKYLSWSLGAEGKRVALVERRYVGGSCPNIACLPSKNVVHSAKVAWYARRLKEFGLNAPPPGIDMTVVRDRKRAMVNGSIEFHTSALPPTMSNLSAVAAYSPVPAPCPSNWSRAVSDRLLPTR